MNDAIFCCSCPGVDKEATAVCQVQFRKNPPIYVGKKIYDLLPDVSGNIKEYLKSLARNKGKFAYYMSCNMDGNVTFQYNLLSRRRII